MPNLDSLVFTPIMALMYVAGVGIIGLSLIARGEMLRAVREIALNTREAIEREGKYMALWHLADIFVALGWIVIMAGIGLPLVFIVHRHLRDLLG